MQRIPQYEIPFTDGDTFRLVGESPGDGRVDRDRAAATGREIWDGGHGAAQLLDASGHLDFDVGLVAAVADHARQQDQGFGSIGHK